MRTSEEKMDTETRLYNLERDNADIRDRLGKVEDKAEGAWKTIKETKEDVGDLYDKIEELTKDVQEVKSTQMSMGVVVNKIKAKQDSIGNDIKIIYRILIGIGAVIIITGLVALKRGSDMPAQVVENLIPVIQQLIK